MLYNYEITKKKKYSIFTTDKLRKKHIINIIFDVNSL
jgi:hypothetical protein